MGAYYLFISCQTHLLSNKKAMWQAYQNEYDRCALAGYDSYTCHHRGVYARYETIIFLNPKCLHPQILPLPPRMPKILPKRPSENRP